VFSLEIGERLVDVRGKSDRGVPFALKETLHGSRRSGNAYVDRCVPGGFTYDLGAPAAERTEFGEVQYELSDVS
jgi:hypothetical protein